MKTVSAETMQELDRLTITRYGVAGIELMERAGCGFAHMVHGRYGCPVPGSVAVFAGKGNNGGDGCVIARELYRLGWRVAVLMHSVRDDIRGDAFKSLESLPEGVALVDLVGRNVDEVRQMVADVDLIVDALLGTGLRNEVAPSYAASIAVINEAGKPVASVDIPSGLDATSGKVLGAAVRADLTGTFAVAKHGHILYPGSEYTGELAVIDIGIPHELVAAAPFIEYFDDESAALLLRPRRRDCHKGDNGHALILAGSTGKSGAAAMAANSAMRSGAGLVTVAVPEALHSIMEIKCTESMTVPLTNSVKGELSVLSKEQVGRLVEGRDVVAIGPGIGTASETVELVRWVVSSISLPLVMDADALNAVAGHPNLLRQSPSSAIIITPHPGEMSRLASLSIAEVESDRLGLASRFARENGVYLVLKGAGTVIAAPDGRMAVNSSGNPGMASGGMGDVLTGVVSALLCQGYEPFSACCLAVYCHGAAADMVAKNKGTLGLVATDVQEMLPLVFKKLDERRRAYASR